MMKIGDFCLKFNEKSRLLIIKNNEDFSEVNIFLRQNPLISCIKVSQCIYADNFIPAAPKLCSMLKEKIIEANNSGKIALIIGFEGIMKLWNSSDEVTQMSNLRNLLDDQSLRFMLYLREWNDSRKRTFSHPKYIEGQMVLEVGEKLPTPQNTGKITLISRDLYESGVPGTSFANFQRFIKEYEDGTLPNGNIYIKAKYANNPIASIDVNIKQIFTKNDFLKEFYALDEIISDSAINFLYEQIPGYSSAISFAQKYFFPNGMNVQEILKEAPAKIRNAPEGEQEVLIWLLRKSIDKDSYLFKVLNNSQFDSENFVEHYVCEAVNCIDDLERDRLSLERKQGLEFIGRDFISGELSQFVRMCHEHDYPPVKIAPWLNLQTSMEKHKLIRMHIQSGADQVPGYIRKVYPLLDKYLEPYLLGNDQLNQYFTEYRNFKVANTVSAEFCAAAANFELNIENIQSRDQLLQTYADNEDTALLVVDALGAEYMPLLLSLAKAQSIGVAMAKIVTVKLPTSTRFNKISFPNERRREDIKALDNIVHDGAERHGNRPFEENFAAELEIFETKIFSEIQNAMAQFEQLILTSDHGATRLATCAYEQNLAETITLPVSEVDDWRFTRKYPEYQENSDLIENLSGIHLAVKGYNRLSKSGGRLFEMHGGATYEEYLVPFILFKRGATFVSQQQINSEGEQFVENDDFDL